MMMVHVGNHHDSRRLEELKRLIEDDLYLSGAVQRIAQVLSNEILGTPAAGAYYERRNKKR